VSKEGQGRRKKEAFSARRVDTHTCEQRSALLHCHTTVVGSWGSPPLLLAVDAEQWDSAERDHRGEVQQRSLDHLACGRFGNVRDLCLSAHRS
jgi:hypothetical protein